MGDKIAVLNERDYVMTGIFDLTSTYKFMKDYIENHMYYDLTEKEYEEKNAPPKYKIVSNLQGEKILNDDYNIVFKGKLTLEGKEVEVEVNGVKKLVEGKGRLTLNCYLDPNSDVDPDKSPLGAFLDKIYKKYIGHDSQEKAVLEASKDIAEILNRFKQQMNSFTK